jgi:hypothetical protein
MGEIEPGARLLLRWLLLYFLIELVSFAFILQAQIGPRPSSQFNQSATFLLRFIPSRLQLSHDAADVSDTA